MPCSCASDDQPLLCPDHGLAERCALNLADFAHDQPHRPAHRISDIRPDCGTFGESDRDPNGFPHTGSDGGPDQRLAN